MKRHVTRYEPEEIKCGEVFDPDYHENYFDVNEVDEYGNSEYASEFDDDENYYSDEEEFFDGYEDWFEE